MNNLKASRVSILDISNNNLTYEDMKLFSAANFPWLRYLVVYPSMKYAHKVELESLITSTKRMLASNLPITIMTTAVDHYDNSFIE